MKKYLLVIWVVFAWNSFVCAENKLPKVYLNHVAIVVDDVTFKGIVKSAFMTKKFANIDAGLPKFSAPNDTSYELFVRGKNTYVDIYSAKNPYGFKEGNMVVYFGVEQINGAKQLYDSLSKINPTATNYPASYVETDSLLLNGKKVANEYLLGLVTAAPGQVLSYAVTEYHPDIMQEVFRKNFKSKPIKRSDFLKKIYNVDKFLSDISEINLQLSKNESWLFVETLKQLNFSVAEKNGSYTAKGNDIVIRIKTAENSAPKLQLKLILNQSKDGNYNLNNSKLEFGGNYATWNFY